SLAVRTWAVGGAAFLRAHDAGVRFRSRLAADQLRPAAGPLRLAAGKLRPVAGPLQLAAGRPQLAVGPLRLAACLLRPVARLLRPFPRPAAAAATGGLSSHRSGADLRRVLAGAAQGPDSPGVPCLP